MKTETKEALNRLVLEKLDTEKICFVLFKFFSTPTYPALPSPSL